MTVRSPRLAATGLLAVGCLALVAACGDDDGADAKTTAACKADVAIDEGFNMLFTQTPVLQSGKPPSRKQLPEVQASYDKFVAGPVGELEKNAPEEISGDVETAVGAAKKFRATGDASPFEESPPVMTALGNMDAYFYDNCDDEKTEVKGPDYGFEGLESSYPAGLRRFKLDNTGKEVHEMTILKRKSGVTENFEQILKLPMEKAQAKVDFVGGADPIDPGKASYGSGDLKPGQYIAVCFLPKGTTSLEKPGKGPPHFVLGMKKEFKVE